MGFKTKFHATTALVAAKTKNVKDEFALAQQLAKEHEAVSDVQRTVAKAEARVLKCADTVEERQEALHQAQNDLEDAKEQLAQARKLAANSNTTVEHVEA